jgi:hypothetical protein
MRRLSCILLSWLCLAACTHVTVSSQATNSGNREPSSVLQPKQFSDLSVRCYQNGTGQSSGKTINSDSFSIVKIQTDEAEYKIDIHSDYCDKFGPRGNATCRSVPGGIHCDVGSSSVFMATDIVGIHVDQGYTPLGRGPATIDDNKEWNCVFYANSFEVPQSGNNSQSGCGA